ncbi:hypothetical protein NDU88_002420 [Pleurodeles waltl]|uniref:Uncharacterized protein n=1 Tax=Pleurodeles waltl TaxID=8319 RepID=A0AAV7W2C3_PLEWA|nr:hypothetical protein NDU88_002420 [Pleurodeles waltl]
MKGTMVTAVKGTETIMRNVARFKRYLPACHPTREDLTMPSEAEHVSDGESDTNTKNPGASCPDYSTDVATDAHMNFLHGLPRPLDDRI